MRFVVAVITRRRPQGLARLMDSLDRLTATTDRGALDVRILVIDNDDAPSPMPPSRWPCVRVLEPRRGIPVARNRALDEAAAMDPALDWLVFVDDDETVDPGWLAALAAATEGATILTGPARPDLPAPVPAWARQTGAYEQPTHPDGAGVNEAYTNNLALHGSLVRDGSCRFDERMMLCGGSDTHLTRRLVRDGRAIRWCAHAVTTEHYPVSRLTRRWAIERAYRIGATNAWIDRDLGLATPTVLIVRAVRFAARGMVRSFVSLVRGQPAAALMHPALDGAKALGLLLGTLGLDRFQEYAVHHGR